MQEKLLLHLFCATINKISEILVRFFLYYTYTHRLHSSQRECLCVYVLSMSTKILLLFLFKVILFAFYLCGGLMLACSQVPMHPVSHSCSSTGEGEKIRQTQEGNLPINVMGKTHSTWREIVQCISN